MAKRRHATDEQLQIIETTEGNIRVGAVPGSGKTYVLTHRIACLILSLFVEPSSIVALTFTNKAAGEMKKRLQSMIGDMATCFMGTFHGYCNKILKEDIHKISYPKTFIILDKRVQIDMLRELAQESGITLKDVKIADLIDRIAENKQSEEYIPVMLKMNATNIKEYLKKAMDVETVLYYLYLKKQRENYALDFEDIIHVTLYILKQHKDVLEKWQSRCQYVLCDEYQDVNSAQEELLILLSGKYHNLTVVGDDDQCIYGWRGSQVEYMVDFHKKYENTQDFTLSENFRSTPEIIHVANSLIEKNENRLLKTMFTKNPSGKKTVYYTAKTEKAEAEYIAETIAKKDGYSYSDFTVLVRAASQTRALEEAFISKKIPYKILSGAQFYSSEEIRTVISYLRLVYALDDLDFVWSIQHPRRGVGKKTMEELKRYAQEKNIRLMEALGELIEAGKMQKQQISSFYENIMLLHNTYQDYSLCELVTKILDMGYRSELEDDVEQTKLDNVAEFMATIDMLETENVEALELEELLAYFALFTAQDDDTGKNAVKIMTIHTAKGLEFPIVFIPGLAEGQFPSKRLRNRDELEEERRLFYVAITRAKKELYLSNYLSKMEGFPVWPSHFMEDIDIAYLERDGMVSVNTLREEVTILEKSEFQVGDIVEHPVFDEGKIVSVNVPGQYYEIDFPKLNGTRQIVFRAKLKKVGE